MSEVVEDLSLEAPHPSATLPLGKLENPAPLTFYEVVDHPCPRVGS